MRREHGSNENKTREEIAGFKRFQSESSESESENRSQIEWAQSAGDQIAGERRKRPGEIKPLERRR
jgi:hypothetical protein